MITRTKIAGVDFPSYVLNASGPKDSTLEELRKIGDSDSAAIMMKSCTAKPRAGNEKPRYARLPYGSLQSMGLPNLGYKKYIEFAKVLKEYKKPVIASVAGLCAESSCDADFPAMVKAFQESAVDLIEINLSCPNTEKKAPIAYDFNLFEVILKRVTGLGPKPLGLKLPPYYELGQFEKVAELVKRYNVRFISAINSIGHALFIDADKEKPLIKPRGGFGGLGGEYIKPVALANVKTFHDLLKDEGVSIFGIGGVRSGTDAFEFLLAGADAVQVATTFEKEGPRCFARINSELTDVLKQKNYKSIGEAKGRLRKL